MEILNGTLLLHIGGRTVELAFVRDGSCLFVATSGENPRWPSSILRTGSARVELNAGINEMSASLVTSGKKRDHVISLFIEKYGKGRISQWYTQKSKVIELSSASQEPRTDPEKYRSWLESEFNAIAENYDTHIFGNAVNALLRERSLELMRREFKKGSTLLEIGCGTGTETLELLKDGHEIVAVDISQNMLDIIRQKAERAGTSDSLETIRLNAEEISSLETTHGSGSFDGVYSNYGAINCVQNINEIPHALSRLLSPGGKLIMGIYNRLCLSEIFGYSMRFKFVNSLARLKKISAEGESRFCIDVYSYTLGEIVAIFSSDFHLELAEGVPVIIPPSNFVNYVEKFQRKFNTIKRLDSWLGKRWPFYWFGDHFLTVMTPNR